MNSAQLLWYNPRNFKHLGTICSEAYRTLQATFEQRGIHTDDPKEFQWLQSVPLQGLFQHLAFRYKNQVFSILVIQGTDSSVSFPTRDINNQVHACKMYHLIPCIYLIDRETLQPLRARFHLIHSQTQVSINIFEKVSDELIPISEWELQVYGVNIALKKIEDEGAKIISYQTIPDISPHIYCVNGKSKSCVAVSSVIGGTMNDGSYYGVSDATAKKYIPYHATVKLGGTCIVRGKLYRGVTNFNYKYQIHCTLSRKMWFIRNQGFTFQ